MTPTKPAGCAMQVGGFMLMAITIGLAAAGSWWALPVGLAGVWSFHTGGTAARGGQR